MQFFNSIHKSKHLLCILNPVNHYTVAMSKPKVFVTMKGVPETAINLLLEQFVSIEVNT